MTTATRSPSTPKQRASSLEALRRQNDLLKKIEQAAGDVRVTDMTDVASSMVIMGIMQMWPTKEIALKYLDATYLKMASIIDADFDGFKREQRKREMH